MLGDRAVSQPLTVGGRVCLALGHAVRWLEKTGRAAHAPERRSRWVLVATVARYPPIWALLGKDAADRLAAHISVICGLASQIFRALLE
jgi:hypothetical protein